MAGSFPPPSAAWPSPTQEEDLPTHPTLTTEPAPEDHRRRGATVGPPDTIKTSPATGRDRAPSWPRDFTPLLGLREAGGRWLDLLPVCRLRPVVPPEMLGPRVGVRVLPCGTVELPTLLHPRLPRSQHPRARVVGPRGDNFHPVLLRFRWPALSAGLPWRWRRRPGDGPRR